jgi:hypothetical protein
VHDEPLEMGGKRPWTWAHVQGMTHQKKHQVSEVHQPGRTCQRRTLLANQQGQPQTRHSSASAPRRRHSAHERPRRKAQTAEDGAQQST